MAMRKMRAGIPKLFKDGYKQFSGVEEAILNNTEAVKQFAEIVRTSFGPNGMNKIVINHLGTVFVTSDCATIVEQLGIEHPAANVVVTSASMQEKEIGDGSNLVVMFAGELLKKAETLIDMGLHPSDIVAGYDKANNKFLELLPNLAIKQSFDPFNEADLAQACRTAISSKCFGQEEFISKLVARACKICMPENPQDFLNDNIRHMHILGSQVTDSYVCNGMLIYFLSKTTTKRVENCKVLVLNSNMIGLREMDASQNVIFNDAKEMVNFSKSEEAVVEATIKRFYDMGIRFLVTGGKPTPLEVHYLNKYGIYTSIVISKWTRRRMCRTTKARPCVTKDFTAEDLGYVKLVEEIEIGGQRVTRVVQAEGQSIVSTVVIRGPSKTIMNDIGRACSDGANTVRAMCREAQFVPGAGATEIELASQIRDYALTCKGLDQYAVKAYAEALEVVPRTLAANTGMDFEDTVAKLYAAHSNPKEGATFGVDVLGKGVFDAVEKGILDLMVTKKFAIRLAVNSVLTILRVDHIIMSKPAGGPKKPKRKGHWDDDDDAW